MSNPGEPDFRRELLTLLGRSVAQATWAQPAGVCFTGLFYSFLIFFFNVYLFLRERQSASGGGAERERDTESEAGSRLRALSTESDVGLEPMNRKIMT